jgi:sec-independent protein translocase protein TatB
MELSFGEMMVIVLAIVVLFGPDKIPEIARGLGQGIRKMKGAMEDVKSEIMKDTDNPISDIKKEIDKVKKAAQEYDPTEKIKQELDLRKQLELNSSEPKKETEEKIDQLSDDYNGPVSR